MTVPITCRRCAWEDVTITVVTRSTGTRGTREIAPEGPTVEAQAATCPDCGLAVGDDLLSYAERVALGSDERQPVSLGLVRPLSWTALQAAA